MAMARIKVRRDFLAAAKARRWSTPGFVLQARDRGEAGAAEVARVGFTASKKVGGAVVRNRAKRRLRALAESRLAPLARAGWDYVLIALAETTASRPFSAMEGELAAAVEAVHAGRGGAGGSGPRSGSRRKKKSSAAR